MVTTAAAAKSLQLCPTLCNPIDGSPPGSPVPGILQARTLRFKKNIYYYILTCSVVATGVFFFFFSFFSVAVVVYFISTIKAI